jgi:hypothetical protein
MLAHGNTTFHKQSFVRGPLHVANSQFINCTHKLYRLATSTSALLIGDSRSAIT